MRVSRRWWEQASIDLEGAKKRAEDVVTVLESESESDSNADPGGEEDLRGASGSSGSEWSGVEWGGRVTPPRMNMGRK